MGVSWTRLVCRSLTVLAFDSLLLTSAVSLDIPSSKSENEGLTVQQLHPGLKHQMAVHGFLLWASVGFLTPVGVLLMRMPKRMEGRRLKVLLYVHAVLQVISVSIATVGAILAVKHLENKFDNTHQRIGLAVYALIWLQPLTALCRPRRGVRGRTVWYFLHWILGTGASLLGIIDIYVGLYAYRSKTSNSVTIWIILFTVEVSCVAFLYLLQDRWDYLYKQGLILELEPLGPTHQVSPLRNKMNAGHC